MRLSSRYLKIFINFILLIPAYSLASPTSSIYENRVAWLPLEQREALLNTASSWDHTTIETFFSVYRHPEMYGFTKGMEQNNELINALWGPLNNPFNKYTRPSKIFVFTNQHNNPYFFAFLIQDKTDQNYYIFDANKTRLTLLDDWINEIKAITKTDQIYFSICNDYGVDPIKPCHSTYQNEVNILIHEKNNIRSSIRSVSAKRLINENWKDKAYNSIQRLTAGKKSIVDESVNWKNINARNELLASIPAWSNYSLITTIFEKIRNIRYYDDEEQTGFLRRITWLYPDDGCWTRASAVIHDLFGPFNNPIKQYTRPAKIFAFGNLCANTPNHPYGKVTWWYHTAPIIKDATTNQSYVLDPSMDPLKPMLVNDWMAAIAQNNGACAKSRSYVENFSICNGYGANPNDNCQANLQNEINESAVQKTYRRYERNRQTTLGREADNVLGESPPWL